MPGIIDNYWQFDNSNGLRSAPSHKVQCVHRKVQLWGWKTWQPRWQRYIPLVYLPQNQTSTVDSYINQSATKDTKVVSSLFKPQTWKNLELICTNGRSHSVQLVIFSTAFTLIHIFRQYCWSTTTMLVNRCNHQVPVKILGHVHWGKQKQRACFQVALPSSLPHCDCAFWKSRVTCNGATRGYVFPTCQLTVTSCFKCLNLGYPRYAMVCTDQYPLVY